MKTMMLKIRNVMYGWSSTCGQIHHYDGKRPCKAYSTTEGVDHPGWTYYYGFRKIKVRSIGIRAEHNNADACFLERFRDSDRPQDSDNIAVIAGVEILAGDAIGEEPKVILANTEVYMLNENGQTIERLW
jgi:hypothetical protein